MGVRHPRTVYGFALVVCRHPTTGKFLIVNESRNRGLWLPGGGVEATEEFARAALRETQEEAGMKVDLKGILRVEFCDVPSRDGGYSRMRVIYYAEPVDLSALPKSVADAESEGALWMSVEEIGQANRQGLLRGQEPLWWAKYLHDGGIILPMSCFQAEHVVPEAGPA